MKAIVENPLLDMRAYAASLFVEILNEITACKNEEELRRCVRLLEKRHKYDKPELSWYFKWGFGHNHFGTDIHIYTGNPSVLGGISF